MNGGAERGERWGSSLKETASTDRHSVQAPVPEQALNKRDSVPVPFGRTDLDHEISKKRADQQRKAAATALISSPTKNGLVRNYAVPA